MKALMLDRRRFLLTLPASFALSAADIRPEQLRIRTVDIIHHSHTDVGYTDLPSITRDMQVRYLDAAIDACAANPQFRWTCEAILTVDDWWRASTAARRAAFVAQIRAGRMDVMALPFNQTPFQNAEQWRQMLAWLPDSVWRQLEPRAGMQNDVNGFPRAGALRLLDKGITHLLMGINADSGGPPFRRPSAFWWKMPDGRRMFVWLGDHYGTAYSYFEPKNWIRGGRGSMTELGPPRPGDFMRTDEQSLRAAQSHLLTRLAKLEADGYEHSRLLLSFTNQWRYDNDPPFPPLADFVTAWNRLELRPALRFTTATDAVHTMEREVGAKIPVREGEWTDWWSNGDASGPRELAASRIAKRKLAAAMSPVWGPMPASAKPDMERILKDLCLFDEHTWGADSSVSQPDAIETIGQYTEKSLLAHRPRGAAEWLLSRRARTKIDPMPEGLYVTNAAAEPYSGWARFSNRALRDDYVSVEDAKSGSRAALIKDGDAAVKFWLDNVPPAGIASLRLSKTAAASVTASSKPAVRADDTGWPVAATWPGAGKPLFARELADFIAVGVIPPANRSTIARMHATADPAKREEMRRKAFVTTPASYRTAAVEETGHSLVYSQAIEHPRLRNAVRRVELWCGQPRAQLTVRFDRVSSVEPEVFYLAFAFPVEGVMPVFSGGDVPFVPYTDQLEGSCRDYYAIDGWAKYATSAGDWLWVTRDAALVSVGGPHTVEKRTTPPSDTHRLLAMVFDNFWHTNFVANSNGTFEFQFELAWRPKIEDPRRLAEALASDPVVSINRATRESPELLNNLFRP
jgi:hypothetical protein